MLEGCQLPWDRFCTDPYSLGDVCQANRTCCPGIHPPHHYQHVEPQNKCLLTAEGGLAMDYVGRVERLDEDFAELLRLLNARPGVPRLPERQLKRLNVLGKKKRCKGVPAVKKPAKPKQQMRQQVEAVGAGGVEVRRLPCDTQDFFRGPHAPCLPAIRSFFAEDFEALGM